MAIMVVKGITLAGMPQILSVEVVEVETEENYPALFASLKIRGLKEGLVVCFRCAPWD